MKSITEEDTGLRYGTRHISAPNITLISANRCGAREPGVALYFLLKLIKITRLLMKVGANAFFKGRYWNGAPTKMIRELR